MKAIVFTGKEKVSCERMPDPRIEQSTDVLVQVELAGICGSDLHVYFAREQGLDHGTVMGHEFVGRVLEAGKDVLQFRKGDLVMCPFTTSCGNCFYCRIGLTSRCERGQLFGWVEGDAGLHGGQAELVRVPLADTTLVHLPEDVSPLEGLLLGDILSTGYFAAKNSDMRPGIACAVVGCGPVGLMAIASAIELGARRVFAIDRIPERLQLAQKFGAEPIDFAENDAVALVREATDGRGADAVLEVVGSAAASQMAYKLVRPGGVISVVGVHTEPTFAFSPEAAYNKNLTYKIGRCPARHLMGQLVPVVQKRRFDFVSIISHQMPLDDGKIGYRIFANKEDGCTKVVLKP